MDTTEAPRIVGSWPFAVLSPLTDWSDDSLGEPIDVADSFDFSDGDTGSVDPMDGEGVRGPAVLDVVDAAERAC